MKRILPLMLALLLVVVPVFAQDDMAPTIAEIVVASTEAETPEFTTLLAAVSAADPSVLEALSNPEASFTVFAPTDAAFAALAEALGEEAFGDILADPAALTSILLYHVVDGAVMSADVVGLLEGLEEDETVPVATLNTQYIDIAGNVEDGITIDDANLVLEMVDIEASNGVIHVIDAVLVPSLDTIADVVVAAAGDEEAPEFTTLLAAVSAADPAVLELLSDPEARLTVFAPTDAAFAALVEALGEEAFNGILADTAALTNILQYHVIDGIVYSWDVVAILEDNMGTFEGPMANGQTVTVLEDEDGNITIGGANLLITDIETANGTIHVIDAVLVPPAE